MFINSTSQFLHQLSLIDTHLKNKNSTAITSIYNELLNELKSKASDFYIINNITVYSENVSFKLLAAFYLLDYIDFFWDGIKFFEHKTKPKNNIYRLLISNTKSDLSFSNEKLISSIEKVSNVMEEQLHVFIFPLSFHSKSISEKTLNGNVLILASNNPLDFQHAFAEFYLNFILKKRLPFWAKSNESYYNEFEKWFNDEDSYLNF